MFVNTHAPNCKVLELAPASTNWTQVTTFPGLDQAMKCQYFTIRAVANASTGLPADSVAGFRFVVNPSTTPAGTSVGKVVSAGGQTEVVPGGGVSLWVKMANVTDVIIIEIFY